MHHRPRRDGFTLIEVIVALTVSGLVLMGAWGILNQLTEHTGRLIVLAESNDRDANAERLLRSLAANIEISASAEAGFGGNERTASFSSWCDQPSGWQERCSAVITVDSLEGFRALTLLVEGRPPMLVREGFAHAELRYLMSAEAGGQWYRVWGRGITAPLAIGIVVDGDTTVVRIGQRG